MKFPEARAVVDEIVHEKTYADRVVLVHYKLPADFVEQASDPNTAVALVYSTGGSQGHYDRTDRVTVEVYAPGEDAIAVAEAIHEDLVNGGFPHDLEVGYVDEIRPDVVPYDVPFASEVVNQTRAVYLVTSRPVE